jgi:internalin A
VGRVTEGSRREAERLIADVARKRGSRLDLSNFSLTALPDSIRQLTNLTNLHLSRNQLTALPDWIGQLTKLTTLYLWGNQLTALPDRIGQLTKLTTLYLSSNQLTALPDSIGQLTKLTNLNLSRNQLTALPDSIRQLTKLTNLNLSRNQLTALPDSIRQLTKLTGLNLSRNQLTALPDWIGQLTKLTNLDLSRNQLTALPDSIRQLTNLTDLNLSGIELTALPDWIGQLTNLTTLDLSSNQLTALPDSIRQLTNLTDLNLSSNEVTALPDSIRQLTNLTNLHLWNNQLTALPDWIGQLTNLTTLDLSSNQLTALPDWIGQLTNLTTLDLSSNQHLSSPPREVQAQGTKAALAYLRALAESSVERWRSKILIVGEAAVGKTSLAKQLLGEAFDPDERQTHGVRVHSLSLPHPDRPEVTMTLDVWDFGGQLEYRATQRFYLTDRSLFLLVWNSRARAADGKVTAWLDAITARAPDSPILLVATHGDENSPATLPHDLRGRYPGIVAVCTIDSRTGLGLDQLHVAIARHTAALPLMGARWPAAWDAAARALDELPDLTVTTHRAFRYVARAGVPDLAAQQAIARMLHDLGQIAYFADAPDLATKIILKPEWLDARITQAIDSQSVTDAGGVLSRAERRRLWADLADSEDDPDLPDRLIRMMEAFDLAYRVGDTDDSLDVALIVDRLPDAPPPDADRLWHEARAMPGTREVAIIYKLASRQAGIPTWFIAREHRYTTGLHWRHGTLLHDRDPGTPAWALLTDDGREQPTVTLRVTGAYPVRFLSVLTEAFDTIIEARYPGLVEARLVPCACQDAVGGRTCTHAFTLEELLAEATANEPDADHKVRCPKTRRKIEAALMLDGLRGTGLTAQLDAIGRTLDAQADTLSAVDARQQAELNGIRTLLEHRANAGVHCPALFSIRQTKRTGLLHRAQITVTLWCEWPSGPHLLQGDDGSYTITKMPDALIRYLPYLRHLITALGLAAPALGSAGVALSDQVKDQIEAAARTLEFIEKATRTTALVPGHDTPSRSGRTIRAETGADFRALHDMLRALDPDNEKNWGRLSPVSRPEDLRTIYLCPRHIHDFDYPYTAPRPAL